MLKRSLFLYLLIPLACHAADTPFNFEDDIAKQKFDRIIEEVRCLVCQNQSLSDSSADLAQDLRKEIYDMVVAGKSDEDILQFLVARYGDFVLYRPPVNATTWLLWFGPFIFLLLSLIAIIRFVKNRSSITSETLSEDEAARLNEILADKEGREA